MTLTDCIAAYEARQTKPEPIDVRAGAITPRGDLHVAVYRLKKLIDGLSTEDRAYASTLVAGLAADLDTAAWCEFGAAIDRTPDA